MFVIDDLHIAKMLHLFCAGSMSLLEKTSLRRMMMWHSIFLQGATLPYINNEHILHSHTLANLLAINFASCTCVIKIHRAVP